MKLKKFIVLVLVAFIGGIVGGFASDRIASIGQAFASGGKKIIEANEFWVVNEKGKRLACFRDASSVLSDKTTVDFPELAFYKNEIEICNLSGETGLFFRDLENRIFTKYATFGLSIDVDNEKAQPYNALELGVYEASKYPYMVFNDNYTPRISIGF